MSLGRRGRILLAVFALALGLLLALSRDTLTFKVRTEGSRVVIETGAHRFEGDLSEADVVDVRYYPQTRFSTGQFLFLDRGFVRNGLAIFAQIGRRPPLEPRAFLQQAGTEVRYVLFNPFRGAFTVHRGQPELRLEVNVPDDALESWQGGRKTQQVKLHPPWLKLTLAPLAAAASLAGLLVALACLMGAGAGAGGGTGASLGTGAAGVPPSARPNGHVVPLLVFAFGVVLSAGIFRGVFHTMPGFGDEMNYLMEGRILASLHLSVPEPPHPEFFGVGWMDMFGADHRVWGFHPPGNSALLALGWLVGIPWITVPLVFGAVLVVQYLLAKDVLGSGGWALVNVLVVATSHYVLSLSSSYMAHAPSFLFLSLYLLLLLRFVRTGRGRFLVLAAAAAGFAFVLLEDRDDGVRADGPFPRRLGEHAIRGPRPLRRRVSRTRVPQARVLRADAPEGRDDLRLPRGPPPALQHRGEVPLPRDVPEGVPRAFQQDGSTRPLRAPSLSGLGRLPQRLRRGGGMPP
jgi:hypothetical protein